MAATLRPDRPAPRWLTELPPSVRKALEPLTPYERRFVQLYCSDAHGNATMAMMQLRQQVERTKATAPTKPKKPKAKVKSKRPKPTPARNVKQISYSVAASMGCQLLMRPAIRVAVAAWMDAFAMSAAEVTYAISDLAQANIGPFISFTKKGDPVLKPELDSFQRHQHWIKRIRTHGRTGKIIELELHDRFAALKEQGKILKLTSDQPILAINMHFQQLSDEEVLAELNRAYAEIAESRHGEDDPRALPPGAPVSIIEPAPKGKKGK